MSNYGNCGDCGGSDGYHFSGCDYEGTGKNGVYNSGKGPSTFGAILCVFGGLVGVALIYMLLGIEADDVPTIISLVLWAITSTVLAVIGTALKG